MTIEQATEIIYRTCNHAGCPISRDLAEHIALMLKGVAIELKHREPGEIARLYRERYEGDVPDPKTGDT